MKNFDLSYDEQVLLPKFLELFPEIQDDYDYLVKEKKRVQLTKKDLEDLRQIEELHGMPPLSQDQPGIYIVVENLVVRVLVALLLSNSDRDRLGTIFLWFEELARSEHFNVRCLVEIGIFESLAWSYPEVLPNLHPYLGEASLEMVKSLIHEKVLQFMDKQTQQLYGVG